MRFWLKITIPLAALSAVAWGAPACTSGTYASYQSLGSGGCMVGNEVFSNFGSLSFSGTIGETFPNTDLIVSPTVVTSITGNVDELTFTYTSLPAGNFSSTVAGVTASEILGYSFMYQVTPSPNPVADIQMTSELGTTGTGNVSAVKQVNPGGTITQSSVNNGMTDFTLPSLVSGLQEPVSGTSAFDVQDAISLQAQTGTAQQENFVNLFTEGSAATVTPEPSTTLLIGSGLLCFGLVRRRRARS